MTNTQKLEQKLGEVLGLEMAAQKAVEELRKRTIGRSWNRGTSRRNETRSK